MDLVAFTKNQNTIKQFISGECFLFRCFLLLLLVGSAYPQNSDWQKSSFEKPLFSKTTLSINTQSIYSDLIKYDVNFYGLDLNVSNTNTLISGNATIIATIKAALDTLCLELKDSSNATSYMKVDSVIVNGTKRLFVHSNAILRISVLPLTIGSKIVCKIFYHGNGGPDAVSNNQYMGKYFTTTWSEPEASKFWFPCKQILEDKADSSQISLTTESTDKTGSNGILLAVENLPDNKIKYTWASKYPIAYYLISFAVGPYNEYNAYAKIDGYTDSVLVQYFLVNNSPYFSLHKIAVEKSKVCLNLFSNLFGLYPFRKEKYGNVLYGGPWGAMENQTLTTTGYEMLDTTANLYAGIAYYFGTAHELGHSWFGDHVTCGSWNDMWINEGFASYCEYIALQKIDTEVNADKWINEAKTTTMKSPGGSVYSTEFLQDFEGYRLHYKKGALILHMLRYEIGNDSVFFNILKTFISRFANKNAIGLDFKAVLEEITNRDFTYFFNQWYFGEGYPIFNIKCVQNNNSLTITSTQTKSIQTAPFFKMPISLKLSYAGGDTIVNLYQSTAIEHFVIPFSKTITKVVFDPLNRVLAKSTVTLTDIEDKINSGEPNYTLFQNYPNPFNPSTSIMFSLSKDSFVELKVYDILGNEIATLVNDEKRAGEHSVKFESDNLSSGIYFYKIKMGYFATVKKMIIQK